MPPRIHRFHRLKTSMTPQDQWVLQREKILAWLRTGFAVVAIFVVQLNPTSVSRYSGISYLSLGLFFFHALVVLYLSHRENAYTKIIGLAATSIDLVCISFIVFSTGGSATPFFVYYLFPIITASSRYGLKGSLITATVGMIFYGFIRFGFVWEARLGIDVLVVRSIYLFLLAYIFGFLSEFEKRQNQKLLALSKTAGDVATLVERRRVMQDLHDGILQSLATNILRLETCRRYMLRSPMELEGELRSIENDTRNSMKEIRQFLQGKETHSVLPGMMIEKIKEDFRFLRDGLGLNVIFETAPEYLVPPEELEQDLYLVLREGLMNVARHSHATRIDLILKQTEAGLSASLRDDGVGFDPAAGNGHGLGLSNMKERVRKLGGELQVQSSPGSGTRISFVLPCDIKMARVA